MTDPDPRLVSAIQRAAAEGVRPVVQDGHIVAYQGPKLAIYELLEAQAALRPLTAQVATSAQTVQALEDAQGDLGAALERDAQALRDQAAALAKLQRATAKAHRAAVERWRRRQKRGRTKNRC